MLVPPTRITRSTSQRGNTTFDLCCQELEQKREERQELGSQEKVDNTTATTEEEDDMESDGAATPAEHSGDAWLLTSSIKCTCRI